MQKNKAIIFPVGKQKKIKKEIFLNGERIVFFERTRSVAWIAHQPSIKRWRAEGRGFKKPAIKVIVAWVSLRVQTIMNGIILNEAEGNKSPSVRRTFGTTNFRMEVSCEEEPPSMEEFSLEQLLGTLNLSKSDFTWYETSSETEVLKPELLELLPEEGKYFVLTDEETDYFVPEVTKTESIKPIQSAWADYSFLEGRDAAEIIFSLEEKGDSLYSSFYPQGEKDLLKV